MEPVGGAGHGAAVMPWGWSGHPCVTPPHRFLVVFNPLEQERLSIVPVLVDSPHVRVLSEEGQPLPSQLSAHWGSATDVVPDVYQVWGAPVPLATPILSLHSPCVPASRSPTRLLWPGHPVSPPLWQQESLHHNTSFHCLQTPRPPRTSPSAEAPEALRWGLCPANSQQVLRCWLSFHRGAG